MAVDEQVKSFIFTNMLGHGGLGGFYNLLLVKAKPISVIVEEQQRNF